MSRQEAPPVHGVAMQAGPTDGHARRVGRNWIFVPARLTYDSPFEKIVCVDQELTNEWSMIALTVMRRIAIAQEQSARSRGAAGSKRHQATSPYVGNRHMKLRVGGHRVIFDVERGDAAPMVA